MSLFKKYFEAIELRKVKPFLKGKKDLYKNRLDDWFKGQDRVYIELNKSENISEKIKSELENEIEKELENTNYVIKDFIDGIAYDNKNKREINLGKVLSELSKKDSSKKHLLDRFNSSTDREGKKVKDVMMVISRHPYDILGQSYDRGWTSCMKLGSGHEESKSLKDEIFITIIAYLIYKDDKNIKRPIARISAYPYINKEDPTDIHYMVQSIIGTAGDWEISFVEQFRDWIDSKENKKNAKYVRSPLLHRDMEQTNFVSFKHVLPDWVIKSGNNPIAFFIDRDGVFHWQNGYWKGGIWEDGIWHNGKWIDGTWKKGTWHNGYWKNGVWNTGIFNNGYWRDGYWNGGKWYSSGGVGNYYYDEIWDIGWIYDPERKGNYDSDWEWKGDHVRSPIAPDEYFGDD